MTRLKPSRELDILISEKIFGVPHDQALRLRAMHDEIPSRILGAGYLYSSDIAAAWTVAERLRTIEGYLVTIKQLGNGWKGRYQCKIMGGPSCIAEDVADTAPMAICQRYRSIRRDYLGCGRHQDDPSADAQARRG